MKPPNSRGAPLSELERKKLNLKAGKLIASHDIPIDGTENEFEELRQELGYLGFADYYLRMCKDDSDLTNKAEVKTYKQLLEIDYQLGTTETQELERCVFYTVRIDLIKVCIFLNLRTTMILATNIYDKMY